jgi:hypothetical protein
LNGRPRFKPGTVNAMGARLLLKIKETNRKEK